jgi:hypothetical protein
LLLKFQWAAETQCNNWFHYFFHSTSFTPVPSLWCPFS